MFEKNATLHLISIMGKEQKQKVRFHHHWLIPRQPSTTIVGERNKEVVSIRNPCPSGPAGCFRRGAGIASLTRNQWVACGPRVLLSRAISVTVCRELRSFILFWCARCTYGNGGVHLLRQMLSFQFLTCDVLRKIACHEMLPTACLLCVCWCHQWISGVGWWLSVSSPIGWIASKHTWRTSNPTIGAIATFSGEHFWQIQEATVRLQTNQFSIFSEVCRIFSFRPSALCVRTDHVGSDPQLKERTAIHMWFLMQRWCVDGCSWRNLKIWCPSGTQGLPQGGPEANVNNSG